MFRSSRPEVFLAKGVLKICSKFIGEHPCRSVISIITLWHGCSPVYLLHIFRTTFSKNTSGWLLLNVVVSYVGFSRLFLHSKIFPSGLQLYWKETQTQVFSCENCENSYLEEHLWTTISGFIRHALELHVEGQKADKISDLWQLMANLHLFYFWLNLYC